MKWNMAQNMLRFEEKNDQNVQESKRFSARRLIEEYLNKS